MLKRVLYPLHLTRNGITNKTKGWERPWRVAAGDTETIRGLPYTLQLSFDGVEARVFDVSRVNILATFLGELKEWMKPREVNAVFFHNLPFDFQALLYEDQQLFTTDRRDFKVEREGCTIAGFVGKTWFARVTWGKSSCWILDSRAFYKSSLKKVAALVGSPIQKLDPPKYLGQRKLRGDPVFEEYIRNDVLAQWHIGKAIAELHRQYDVPLAVSLPHFSSRVFCRTFVKPGQGIDFPPMHVVRPAELSFHGGKIQMTARPGWYGSSSEPCYEMDINSAYTWALTKLPSMLKGKYLATDEIPFGKLAVMRVSGRTRCKYGCVFTHDMKFVSRWDWLRQRYSEDPVKHWGAMNRTRHRLIKSPDGWTSFEHVWMTQPEVESALRHGCLELKDAEGYYWDAESEESPLADFARYFYALKASETKGTLGYNTAKLIANSLYGKFIQNMLLSDEEAIGDEGPQEEPVYKAGGLYNPFVATGITGHVRALIHDLEHKYDSLHTSTDAVKTMRKPDPADINTELGGLSLEITGRCVLFRPKLYIHESFDEFYTDKETGEQRPKTKYALHGFQGTMEQLRDAEPAWFKGEKFEYFCNHVWSMREVHRRKDAAHTPLDFVQVKRSLNPPDGMGLDYGSPAVV